MLIVFVGYSTKTLDAVTVIIQTQATAVNRWTQKKGAATIRTRKRKNEMGVYIKGMEMPTGERPVHIEIHRDGTVIQWKFNESDEIIGTAVEVPPHGRLVDADAFEKENAYFWDRDFINPKYEDTLADLVNAAPTIIEAEE